MPAPSILIRQSYTKIRLIFWGSIIFKIWRGDKNISKSIKQSTDIKNLKDTEAQYHWAGVQSWSLILRILCKPISGIPHFHDSWVKNSTKNSITFLWCFTLNFVLWKNHSVATLEKPGIWWCQLTLNSYSLLPIATPNLSRPTTFQTPFRVKNIPPTLTCPAHQRNLPFEKVFPTAKSVVTKPPHTTTKSLSAKPPHSLSRTYS